VLSLDYGWWEGALYAATPSCFAVDVTEMAKLTLAPRFILLQLPDSSPRVAILWILWFFLLDSTNS
jgi:hypothetical protein